MQPQEPTSDTDSVFGQRRNPSPIRRFDDSDSTPQNYVDLGTGGVHPEDHRTGVNNGLEHGVQSVDQQTNVDEIIHRTERFIITQPEEERRKIRAVSVPHEGALLPRSVPSHLLIISLLECLCMAYTDYHEVSGKQLFQMISEYLIKKEVVSPLTVLDEVSSLRSQYRYIMHNVLEAGMHKISSQEISGTPPRMSSLMMDDEERNRYKAEFIEMEELGEGGFGKVYKAKHNLDGKLYAIKKIKFELSKPDEWMKIQREVKALANLQHPNIVGYNAAWMEYQTLHSEAGESTGESQQSVFPSTESDDGIQFEELSDEAHKQLSDKDSEDYQSRGSTDGMRKEKSVLKDSEEDTSEYSEDLTNSRLTACLFIQMELCSLNLKEWMFNRNETCKTQAEFVCYETRNMNIFRQILKGLDFIHSQGRLHRDIKPTNIFLCEPELHVKIGDFGLAKDDLISSSQENVLLSPTPNVETSTAMFCTDDHTPGVGTKLYAAPEQLYSRSYNNKCDVYSLGIMLYEIFHKFDTEMERRDCLNKLRGECCIMDDEYTKSWKIQSEIVAQMIDKAPDNRPTTKNLLVSKLFITKDQMIKQLQAENKQLQTENKQLQTEVEDKDLEIKRLKNLLAG